MLARLRDTQTPPLSVQYNLLVITLLDARRSSGHKLQAHILFENRDFSPSNGVLVGILP